MNGTRPSSNRDGHGEGVDSHFKCNTWWIKISAGVAYPRHLVVSVNQVMNPLVGQGRQVGFTGQGATQAADGVLDAAFLPGGVKVTEEGLNAEGMEAMMRGELRPIVEGDGLAAVRGHRGEEVGEGVGDGGGGFARGAHGEEKAGGAFVESEDGLAVGAEEHQIGFPMAGSLAVGGHGGALGEGAAVSHQGGGTAAFAPAAAGGFGVRQIVPPGIGFRPGDLSVEEAVDGFVREDGAPGVAGEAACDLLGGPALLQVGEDCGAEGGIAIQLGPAPPAGAGLLLGIPGLVALGAGVIALHLASHG